MSELPKYLLVHNHAGKRWDLVNRATGQVTCTFATKEDATRRGVLESALGTPGGSVTIRKMDGTFQDERSYPQAELRGRSVYACPRHLPR